MAGRRETPDVLGELLAGGSDSSPPEPVPEARPRPLGEADLAAAQILEPGSGVARAAESKPAPRPRAPRRKASQPSQAGPVRWEYVEIVFCNHRGFRPRTINGQEARNWKKTPLIYEYLNHLGAQGWELAGVVARHKNEMSAYLKRPIS